MTEGSLNTARTMAEIDFRREEVRRTFADLKQARKARRNRRHGLV